MHGGGVEVGPPEMPEGARTEHFQQKDVHKYVYIMKGAR